MIMVRKTFSRMKKQALGGVVAGVLSLWAVPGQTRSQEAPPKSDEENQPGTVQGKLYCNSKALNPAERTAHKQLTEKLIAERKEIVETEKGYEFQFSPAEVSLATLANWVVAEGKCCPFFDFHIDLEREGRLLCLRLTGEEGIKAFIRKEFQVPAK
jgi:hypothetical protein